ncbi:hypothetical protein MNBD_GAMMA11-708 [hydrothermal vent metagenome]|uniref:Uncharacterized protein n=1 Tax=hydrothermal vent metagenome TaxID=652676 RepID=A0A3B0X4V2_9ZZZZ
MNKYIKFCSGLTESPEIVKALKENVITKIVRVCNPITIDRFISKNGVIKNNIFNVLSGTVLFFLENDDAIGFDIDDNKFSIVSWYAIHNGEKYNTEYFIHDLGLSYISHNDPLYSRSGEWDHVVGHKIKKIRIIDYDDGRHRRDFKDSFQKAIVFETDDGDMVISDLPGVRTVLPLIRKSKIPKEIWDNSKIIEI